MKPETKVWWQGMEYVGDLINSSARVGLAAGLGVSTKVVGEAPHTQMIEFKNISKLFRRVL